jgi:hypothetical protein
MIHIHADGTLTNLCVRLLKLIARIGPRKPFSLAAAKLLGDLALEIDPEGECVHRPLCVFMYVCMCIYIYTYMRVFVCVYIHKYTHRDLRYIFMLHRSCPPGCHCCISVHIHATYKRIYTNTFSCCTSHNRQAAMAVLLCIYMQHTNASILTHSHVCTSCDRQAVIAVLVCKYMQYMNTYTNTFSCLHQSLPPDCYRE